MPPLNWDKFAQLPGSVQSNFETLCRILIRRHYGRYGAFAALAAQPGVEFHLKLHTPCPLGEPGRWYGWQCRWYDLPSGRALGNARREKIKKAVATTEKELPGLTDWVLWTRHPLTKGDQKWFYGLTTRMRRHLWTATEVEEHLSGDAQMFRETYFGDLVLSPENLCGLHLESVAPIRQRWLPEVHQAIDAERVLRQMLGESGSWNHLQEMADQLGNDAKNVSTDIDKLDTLADVTKKVVSTAVAYAESLSGVYSALVGGDLDLLWEESRNRPARSIPELNPLPRQLRARRHVAALSVTNAISDIRTANQFLDQVETQLGKRLIAVLADVGCGKTQLAAQLTAATNDRPCGVLLLGRYLHAAHGLDDLARKVVIHGKPIASMEALIAALDAAGQRAHRRLPLVIDGLNEAEDSRNWKPLLATLSQSLRSYPYVFVICTVRPAFADEALPQDAERLNIPDFGHDSISAIRKYFAHYRINATDAELPIGLLKHPLTLRLFCEVANPTRKRIVGTEAMPKSLTALFDRYLEQAATRIAELAPRTRRYFDHDIRFALNAIGTVLWEEKVRDVDLATLRDRLGDSERPWNESIVSALEQEGVLLPYPGEPPGGPTVAVVYDALAGHIVASAILTKYGQTGFATWLKEPTAVRALDGASPDQHPLALDTFRALVGLVPRRLHSQQLWTLIDPPLRIAALRASADLEATYLDAATVSELSKLVVQAPAGKRDLFDRLWQTRGAEGHPLNADFLDCVLRTMKLADRDLCWTEWMRRHHEELIADVTRIEKRWRRDPQRPSSERLRARWIMWTLSSTVRELRDRATRALYWFGRGDPAGLFRLTLDALVINDPYVSERTLAAAYGTCMALHCRPNLPLFRTKLLPAFAKRVYEGMFARSAAHSTTHALSRDYARRIIDVARFHEVSLLTDAERARVIPPFKDGGIREWQVIEDPNKEKYREGNSPLGMDFANYTIGGLVPHRHNYQFEDEEYKRVVGQITWRLYQLGYSLEAFGAIDKAIANRVYFGRAERPTIERYGKKYARIAYFEQYGFRQDEGLLDTHSHEPADRPSEADIDPSFPDDPHQIRLIENILGDRSADVRSWVDHGPTPEFRQYLLQPSFDKLAGPWILLDGHCSQRDKGAERLGFVSLQSFLLLEEDLDEFIHLIKREPPRGKWLPDPGEDHYTFAGEIPWCDTFPRSELQTVDFVTGKTRVKVSPNDFRHRLPFVLSLGNSEQTPGGFKPPKFEEINLYRKIPVYVPIRNNSFTPAGGVQRTSCIVPTKELADLFQLWLKLPSWNMHDQSGKQCSAVVEAGSLGDYERYLFLRKELIDQLLSSQDLALVWVVWGERQHFGERHSMTNARSHGYKYFQQVYRYAHGQPKRVATKVVAPIPPAQGV